MKSPPIKRVSEIRIEKMAGGVRIECDLSETPNARWRDAFALYQQVAPYYFNQIRVVGSKIVAESADPNAENLTAAIDKRIESASLRTNT